MNKISLRALLLAGATLLSGCFESSTPKFALAGATRIFGTGGRYTVYEHVEGDQYKRQEILTIATRPDGGYDLTNEAGKTQPASFYALTGGRFVGQVGTEKEGDVHYGYVALRIAGDEALLYLPQCDEQDETRLAALGVTRLNQYECSLDGVADPGSLFDALNFGEPVSKLVKE